MKGFVKERHSKGLCGRLFCSGWCSHTPWVRDLRFIFRERDPILEITDIRPFSLFPIEGMSQINVEPFFPFDTKNIEQTSPEGIGEYP
jgi:hypothetical protein